MLLTIIAFLFDFCSFLFFHSFSLSLSLHLLVLSKTKETIVKSMKLSVFPLLYHAHVESHSKKKHLFLCFV